MPTSVHTGITPFGDLGRGESRVQTEDLGTTYYVIWYRWHDMDLLCDMVSMA